MENITKEQYEYALERIEALLPLIDESTPMNDKNMIELALVSDVVEQYEELHYPIEKPTLGEIILDALDTMGMTAKELAGQLGISASRVSDYIHNRSEPTLKIARGLCKTLNITPAEILGL